jgi:hypothetical protein
MSGKSKDLEKKIKKNIQEYADEQSIRFAHFFVEKFFNQKIEVECYEEEYRTILKKFKMKEKV